MLLRRIVSARSFRIPNRISKRNSTMPSPSSYAHKKFIEPDTAKIRSSEISSSLSNHQIQEYELTLSKIVLDIAVKTNNNYFSLCVAMETGNERLVKLLLDDSRIDINATNAAGRTVLMATCADFLYSNICSIHILIDNGADVNAKDSEGKTALMHAINNINYYDGFRRASILINHRKTDLTMKDNDNHDALWHANNVRNNREIPSECDLVKMLNDYGVKSDDSPETKPFMPCT